MSAGVRVAAFVGVLALVLGFGFGAGRLFLPDLGSSVAPAEGHGHGDEAGDEAGDAEHAEHGEEAPTADSPDAGELGGLTASAQGYTIELAEPTLQAGRRAPLAFTIRGDDGAPVTAFDEVHEKRLHLIVVRRDLTGFQHVHPQLDATTGVWSTPVTLTPGSWRVFADARPTGSDPLVLGAELAVPGDYRPTALGAESRTATVDGYQVRLVGDATPGADTTLTLEVSRNGRPVTDLQPYLGAYGHLVALREGDLGYLHVHPEDGPAGPEITFHTTFPTAGGYRLFLDFRHGGVVRTAAFTVHAGGHGIEDDEEAGHDH